MPLKHGNYKRPEYVVWERMRSRCNSTTDKRYASYGGRGIQVCEAWNDFNTFLADMGVKPPGMSIERMDNEKSYEPGNCKWATKIEQARNTRANKFVSYKGNRMTQAELAEVTGHNQSTVSYRLRSGWTPEQVANTPAHTGNRVASKLGNEVDVPKELL